MSQMVAIQLEIPDDLARFRLPSGVNTRLQELLDRQDSGKRLTAAERKARGWSTSPRCFRCSGCGWNRPVAVERRGHERHSRSLTSTGRVASGKPMQYCHLAQKGQEATFHVDHILPKAVGGRTTAANLALACVSCSLRKEARRSLQSNRIPTEELPCFIPPPAVARPLSLGRISSCRANADG
jgi:5-methylcytosine-specific restriction endonuclease McrA